MRPELPAQADGPPRPHLACNAEFPLASMVRRSAAAACIPISKEAPPPPQPLHLTCNAEFPLASMARRSAAAACIPPSSDTQLHMSGALALQTSRMMRSWSAATARKPPCMASTTAQRLLVVAAAAAAAGGAAASSPVTTTAGPGGIMMGGARIPASLSRMRRSCEGL